jgi:hypothetical protein
MAGMKGRSGGMNRVSVDLHRLRGTFRNSRHAGATQTPRLATAALDGPLPVPDDLITGLFGRGRRFVEAAWANYAGWGVGTRELLREAGMLFDQLETLRGQRGERAAQRLLVTILASLHLED